MLEQGLTKITQAALVNFNLGLNVSLLSFRVTKPIRVQRFGVIATTATGLFAASVVKLRAAPAATDVEADVAGETLTVGVVVAQGGGVYKDVVAERKIYMPGDRVVVAVAVAAGAASTGEVFMEYAELPFAGSNIANMTAVLV